jgi:Protein of unknown function (DUF3306)
MADGFLGRWSRRKAGKQDELAEKSAEATPAPAVIPASPDSEVLPPASLEDVEKIDRFAPDFSAFMKPDVDPAVQQAAMKKMFTDPHFNIMDGLDIYIGDYSKPDPLPPGMLERMVQSDMLNLFRKPADELAKEANQEANQEQKQANQQSAEKQLQDDSLGVKNQTDLTSSHSSSDKRSDELEKLPVEPAQKKT